MYCDPFDVFPTTMVKLVRLPRTSQQQPEVLAEKVTAIVKRTTQADVTQQIQGRTMATRVHLRTRDIPSAMASDVDLLLGLVLMVPGAATNLRIQFASGGDDYDTGTRAFITVQCTPYSRTTI